MVSLVVGFRNFSLSNDLVDLFGAVVIIFCCLDIILRFPGKREYFLLPVKDSFLGRNQRPEN